MLPITTDLIDWINNLKFAAHTMILEDNILEKAPEVFRQCESIAKKSDGVHCDGDEGAFTLMTTLFCDCLLHQFDQVELLFSEYFPLMSPNWKLHREIWLYRFLMYQRFQLSNGKIRELCNELESRIQSGKILNVQSKIYEHWLMADD